ncbi:hypothetical protein A2875_00550 [Candidatus Gottesmanbacteria bacterium RIFCSPHIGHO2_01_FULL_46_14]|uniref:Uncharacterized protein n=1 Tax=Candidatus Gottesmanbacteria bacterium RIFCSPHIGHO2_01_FULL_46_14 TaxID=1798380 RepID=A0A1F5ZLS8_9BACT|nr:MAG: hypothetical protein A2875_00550 [Candidatus Gottesmanbacteria bacterium RIFCSPHIGHO2_01_FULL_46_14]
MQQIIPIRSSTQDFTEIEDVNHDVVLFVDGSTAMILATTAVNFGLLSEKEQEAMIYAYAGLLNSLSFPVQILIRSQHKDVTSYLRLLEEQEIKQKNPKLASSINSYRLFVAETVKEKEVLDKKFYVVIPFSSLELGTSTKVLFGSKKRGLPYPKEYIFDKALMVLSPKRDQLTRLLHRIGLRAMQLTNEQIVQLLFSIYNPESPAPSFQVMETTKP